MDINCVLYRGVPEGVGNCEEDGKTCRLEIGAECDNQQPDLTDRERVEEVRDRLLKDGEKLKELAEKEPLRTLGITYTALARSFSHEARMLDLMLNHMKK